MGLDKEYNRVINFIKKYKKIFFKSIFFNLFYAIFNVIALFFIIPILTILFNENYVNVYKKPSLNNFNILNIKTLFSEYLNYYFYRLSQNYSYELILLLFCILFILTFLIRNIFNFLSEYNLITLKLFVSRDYRILIHNKVISLPLDSLKNNKRSDIFTLFSSDVTEIENNIFGAIIEIIRAPIFIIITLIVLFSTSYKLTLVVFVLFPIMSIFISYIGKTLKKSSYTAQEEFSYIISKLYDSINNIKVIKSFNCHNKIIANFNNSIYKYYNNIYKIYLKRTIASPISELLGAITIAIIIYFGGRMSMKGSGLTGAQFIFYISNFYTILDPIKRIARSFSDLKKGKVSLNRIDNFLYCNHDEIFYSKKHKIQNFNFNIEIKNMTFNINNINIINGISFSIKKGQKIGIIGASGSGKSTLLNILLGFHSIDRGIFKIDGKDFNDIDLISYRNLISYVPQDCLLFYDSIQNNIVISDNKNIIDSKKLHKSSILSNSLEFINKFTNNYNEIIKDNSLNISGGQKQRLNIARAIYKESSILILDEPTSSLDSKNEDIVMKNLLDYANKNFKTLIMVSHNFNSVKYLDNIIVMDHGKIIEYGTHDQLINKKGLYNKYYNFSKI